MVIFGAAGVQTVYHSIKGEFCRLALHRIKNE